MRRSEPCRWWSVADLLLTDLRLPGMDGLRLLVGRMREAEFAGSGDRHDGLRLHRNRGGGDEVRRGRFPAEAIFARPPDDGGAKKRIEMRALRDENQQFREELDQRYRFDNIIGRSAPMREIFATIKRVAPTRATVLLAGESGVGKDLIARAIHPFAAPRPAVRQDQLHGAAREPDGERIVRVREGRVYRRQHEQAGQVRAGRYRNGVSG